MEIHCLYASPLFCKKGRRKCEILSMCLNKSWRCSRDRLLCTSLPVAEIRKDLGLAGGKSAPVRISSDGGPGEKIRTEHEAEYPHILQLQGSVKVSRAP